MSYFVKEVYYTLQGEGANAGRAAVFCRFAGCNLWSGREEDRAAAVCNFCDTDFVGTDGPGGGSFGNAESLASAIQAQWPDTPQGSAKKLVVCTGGEPLLQMDSGLVASLHRRGFEVAIETNGTCGPPQEIDWICVSPKAGADLLLTTGDELKFIYPQPGLKPENFIGLDFKHFFLQPMDGPHLKSNTESAVRYCLADPRWRLSLQLHKVLGIP
jgi:7-carboxy-7-deazaguanine synthase